MVVDDLSDAEVDRIFHALADATRRDILRHALGGEHSVSALARRYPISVPAVQKHVATLERAGLVTRTRRGRETLVSTELEAVRRAIAVLDTYEELWRHRVAAIDDLFANTTTEEP